MAILRIAEGEEMPLDSYSEEEQHQILTYMLSPDFYKATGNFSQYHSRNRRYNGKTRTFYSQDDMFHWTDLDFLLLRDGIIGIPELFAEHVLEFYGNGGELNHVLDCETYGEGPRTPAELPSMQAIRRFNEKRREIEERNARR